MESLKLLSRTLSLKQEKQIHQNNLSKFNSYVEDFPQFEIIQFNRQVQPLQLETNVIKPTSKKRNRKRILEREKFIYKEKNNLNLFSLVRNYVKFWSKLSEDRVNKLQGSKWKIDDLTIK
jgi:hypothetical protein